MATSTTAVDPYATPTTPATKTTSTNQVIPNTTQQLTNPATSTAGNTVQSLNTMLGGAQTPGPATGQVMDPLAFSGAPAGFTQGTGTMAGATYYNGSKVIGFDQAGNPQTENGQTIQGAGPALQQWINSPQFNQAEAVGINSQPAQNAPVVQQYLDSTASDRALQDAAQAKIRANPDYQMTQEESDASARLNAGWGDFYQGAQQRAAALGMTPGAGSGYYDASGNWINPATAPAEYLQGGLRTYADGTPVTGANAYNALSDYYSQSGKTPGVINSVVMDLLNKNPQLMTTLPQDQYDNLKRSLSTMVPGFNIPARASDTSPGGNLPQNIPALTAPQTGGGTGTGATGATGGTTTGSTTGQGSGLAPNVSPVNPNSDLRNMQITPGDMLDRFALAQQQYGTFADATSPQYEAALRDATRAAAGAGRLGSGMLRTSYGDLANQRTQSLQNERDTLFQNALLGSVNDAQTKFQDLMAEQAYQTGAQNQAFNQAVTAQQLQETLTSGAFSRALQSLNAGELGNPADMEQALAQMYSGQAGQAGTALAMLLQSLASGGNNSNAATNNAIQQLLQIARNAGTAGTSTGTTTQSQKGPGGD